MKLPKDPITLLQDTVLPLLRNKKQIVGAVVGDPVAIKYQQIIDDYLLAIELLVRMQSQRAREKLSQLGRKI